MEQQKCHAKMFTYIIFISFSFFYTSISSSDLKSVFICLLVIVITYSTCYFIWLTPFLVPTGIMFSIVLIWILGKTLEATPHPPYHSSELDAFVNTCS